MEVHIIVTEAGMIQARTDLSLYFLITPDGTLHGVFLAHYDDFLRGGDELMDKRMAKIRKELVIGTDERGNAPYLGMRLREEPPWPNYPKGECEPLFSFYSADNNDNTVARNISRPGYTQVSGGANATGHVAGYVSRVSGDGLVPLKLWWCE